jgi:hypothetical protein
MLLLLLLFLLLLCCCCYHAAGVLLSAKISPTSMTPSHDLPLGTSICMSNPRPSIWFCVLEYIHTNCAHQAGKASLQAAAAAAIMLLVPCLQPNQAPP